MTSVTEELYWQPEPSLQIVPERRGYAVFRLKLGLGAALKRILPFVSPSDLAGEPDIEIVTRDRLLRLNMPSGPFLRRKSRKFRFEEILAIEIEDVPETISFSRPLDWDFARLVLRTRRGVVTLIAGDRDDLLGLRAKLRRDIGLK